MISRPSHRETRCGGSWRSSWIASSSNGTALLAMTLGRRVLRLRPCVILVLCFALRPDSSAQIAPDPIEGRWTGTISAPQGDVEEFGLDFFRNKRGNLIFRMSFPAMFTYNAPFPILVEADGQGNYAINDAFAIKLHREGDQLRGTFGAGLLPLVLRRGGKFSEKPAAPVYPPAPAPLWSHALGAGTWAPPVVAG